MYFLLVLVIEEETKFTVKDSTKYAISTSKYQKFSGEGAVALSLRQTPL